MTNADDNTTAAYRLADWIGNRSSGETITTEGLDRIAADVAELLAENAGLRRLANASPAVGLAANAFGDGWHSAFDAVSRMGGWAERERAWRTFREQMIELVVKGNGDDVLASPRMPLRGEMAANA